MVVKSIINLIKKTDKKTKPRHRSKILTPKKMLQQILLIALAQGSTKEITEKVYNNIINSI